MSLRIIEPGILETIQDTGRYGFQHLGINPSGVMDPVAMKATNLLVGNHDKEAVLEIHFPAAIVVFEKVSLVAIAGADFAAELDGSRVDANSCFFVRPGNELRFRRQVSGARCYLSVKGGFLINEWLNSKSTNLKAGAGGFNGRALQKNDVVPFATLTTISLRQPFSRSYANLRALYNAGPIRFLQGSDFDQLDEVSKNRLVNSRFCITQKSDRMGCRLQGEPLTFEKPFELLSGGVTNGTMQLLPNGQVILLMADHQTTGGYPKIGHVISFDIPALAQKQAGDSILFEPVGIHTAEQLLLEQSRHLLQLKNACNFQLETMLPQA